MYVREKIKLLPMGERIKLLSILDARELNLLESTCSNGRSVSLIILMEVDRVELMQNAVTRYGRFFAAVMYSIVWRRP